MSVVYFDSSAFVKLLVEEDGSRLAADLWDNCDAAVSSRLAYPEVLAALGAATRAGRLNPGSLRLAVESWEQYWQAIRAVELAEPVAVHAGELAYRHALGGADAVHLASALLLQPAGVVLATWDKRLRTGAEAEAVRIAPAVLD